MKTYIKTTPRYYDVYTFFRETTNHKHPVDVVFKKTVSQDVIKSISKCTAEMVADIEVGAKPYTDGYGNACASPVIYVNKVYSVEARYSIKADNPKDPKEPKEPKEDLQF